MALLRSYSLPAKRQEVCVIGRKRISTSSNYLEGLDMATPPQSKRRAKEEEDSLMSPLESISYDILLKILCKVNHSDLKNLILVAKFINQAALDARKSHFLFSTPNSHPVFDKSVEDGDDDDARNAAPMRRRTRSPLDAERIRSLTSVLFPPPDAPLHV